MCFDRCRFDALCKNAFTSRKEESQTTSKVYLKTRDYVLDSARAELQSRACMKRNGPLNVKTIEQSLKRNGPLNVKTIEQSLKRNGPLNVKTIEQSLKRNGSLDARIEQILKRNGPLDVQGIEQILKRNEMLKNSDITIVLNVHLARRKS